MRKSQTTICAVYDNVDYPDIWDSGHRKVLVGMGWWKNRKLRKIEILYILFLFELLSRPKVQNIRQQEIFSYIAWLIGYDGDYNDYNNNTHSAWTICRSGTYSVADKNEKKTYNSRMRISYPPGSVLEIEYISVPVFLLSLPPYNHTTIIQQTPADLIHRKI